MGPVKAEEWLQLSLGEPAAIDCSRPLGAPYLRLTLYFCRISNGLQNNRDHAHLKQGLWKAYQLGFEGQANSPSRAFHLCLPTPALSWEGGIFFAPSNTSEDSIQLNTSQLQLLPKWKVN